MEELHPDLGASHRVKLAHEASFTVGNLTVNPTVRQIVRGAEQQTLEPRVMQVLVALVRAGGKVVSKDDLIDCCWQGRVVGDDAINRVVSHLRQTASTFGGSTFRIDTIRGVGFRLVETETSADPHAAKSPSPDEVQRGLSRRTASLAAVATAALAAGMWFRPGTRGEPSRLAQEYYQRGLETRGRASLELSEQGAALFREATRIEPEFAEAWGALAWNYRGLLEYGPRPDTARLHAMSRSAARRALELDADNVDAQAALLLLEPFYGRWAEIENGCRDLLSRHPNNSILEFNLAFTLCEVGRWRESVVHLRAVADRQPFWPLPHIRLMQSLYSSGKIEEADDLIEDGMKRFPRRRDYWLSQIRSLAISGRVHEALAFANDMSSRPAEGQEPAIDFEVMVVRALAEGTGAARDKAVQRLILTAKKNRMFLPNGAVSAAVLGALDVSFSMLDGYYFGHGPWGHGRAERRYTSLLFIGSSGSLRSDPRFGTLLKKAGLEDYWRRTGTSPDYRLFG